MYASIRRLATFSIVLAIFNLLATILLLFYFDDMIFTVQFTWIVYTASASIGFFIISCALFGLSKDLALESSSNSEYLVKLSKRIKALEDRAC